MTKESIEVTIKNLKGLKLIDPMNDVVEAFDSELEIIVSSPLEMNNFNPKDGVHYAYENVSGAVEIAFEIKEMVIIDAWEVE